LSREVEHLHYLSPTQAPILFGDGAALVDDTTPVGLTRLKVNYENNHHDGPAQRFSLIDGFSANSPSANELA